MTPSRPELTRDLTGVELRTWYWRKDELVDFARSIGITSAGGKIELTARLVAVLDGAPPPPAAARRGTSSGRQLAEPLTTTSVLPPGQRCSQELRRFFTAQIGPGFRFDKAMRDFVADGAGRTLGEGLQHWRRTRSQQPTHIEPQFELNRFLREWHRLHPGGARSLALEAWKQHRATPRSDLI